MHVVQCPPGRAPRALTASGKAKSPPQSLKRVAYDFVDRRGFAHTLGEISTSPQNEATVNNLAGSYEEYDFVRRLWLAAKRPTVRMLSNMTPEKRGAFLRVNRALYRRAPAAEAVVLQDNGEAYVLPQGYGRKHAEDVLDKAVKGGFLSFGGRTLRIDGGHASPAQGARDAGTIVYVLRGARGAVRFTREALLASIERGYL